MAMLRSAARFTRPVMPAIAAGPLQTSRPAQRYMHGDPMAFSAPTSWSNYSLRQRYPALLKGNMDTVMTDHFYEDFQKYWFADWPSYNYWMCWCACSAGAGFFTYRDIVCHPETHWRKGEQRLHHPDRDRNHAYSLPYYNHRLKNLMTRYNWLAFDNDWDYNRHCPTGIRPERSYSRRRPLLWNIASWMSYRYPEDDPLLTTISHDSMEKLYHNSGYKKIPGYSEEEE